MNKFIEQIKSFTTDSVYFCTAESEIINGFERIYLEFEIKKIDLQFLEKCLSITDNIDCHIFNNGMMCFRVLFIRIAEYPF